METFQEEMKKLSMKERRSYVRDHPELDAEHLRSLILISDEEKYIAMTHNFDKILYMLLIKVPDSLYQRREEEIEKVVDVMKTFFSAYEECILWKIVQLSDNTKELLLNTVDEMKTVTMTDKILNDLNSVAEDLKANPERSWKDSFDKFSCDEERKCTLHGHGTILGEICPGVFCRHVGYFI